MQESGIDMTSHTSDVIHPAILNRAAYVITLCGHAAEHVPSFRIRMGSSGIGDLMTPPRLQARKKRSCSKSEPFATPYERG